MPGQTACGKIKLKRAYERPDFGDGTRILVDRLMAARRQESRRSD
jgi:uncharacterized protein YeaO (DUF488 family)